MLVYVCIFFFFNRTPFYFFDTAASAQTNLHSKKSIRNSFANAHVRQEDDILKLFLFPPLQKNKYCRRFHPAKLLLSPLFC